ncbi:MAG: hypothetical protein AUJ52_09095 [Elusimicrobia bacterium CG1_02_63_36]|nr:MAG: hypothetical protein AUJ52_09095 [Elusimicrobia bacterium CG1_02_63_36]PIP84057.1 MAG: hypothetical protein COR54_06335 [Elusimicrobia bacterium CG22_combo_CG10-13_8_21_14_all_63_91]PJA12734.1 MAG: hypothetical protein COX66_16850 [Elusimicrobia bacterium CG_4_10_14_0_2_um_filter_63_34]PJB24033.1 MAG: hypothetical protein CO113_16170 [Elusimicrobia bacterium CG_4_9_14_3_um_filter_62_55]
MTRSLLLVAAFVSLAAPARAAGLESLSLTSAGAFEAAAGVQGVRTTLAASALRVSGRPYFGSLTGSQGGAALDLRFDRRAWSVVGIAKSGSVDLRVDHAATRITGFAGTAPVQIAFQWHPQRMAMRGTAMGSPLELIVDFDSAALRGHAAGAPVQVAYDKATGSISGSAKHLPVRLSYDRISGRLHGTIGGDRVEATLMNLEIGDFLQYFFLFLS